MAEIVEKEKREDELFVPRWFFVALLVADVCILYILCSILFSEPVHAADGEPWKNWGAAPYATSQEDACKKLSEAIDGFTMPLEAKAYFKRVVGVACNGGAVSWLTPGMALEQMWSGPDSRHKEAYLMNQKSVAELPVLKSPDGRSYRKGAVAETAKALSWTFVCEGKTCALYLPFACFNWSWGFVDTLEPCSKVEYTVMPGDVVVFAFLEQALLPASACLQLCDGGECSSLPSPCDDCDWLETLKVLPPGLKPLQTGMYAAKSAKQSLRFPREATAAVYVGIAVTREGLGQSDAWIVQPSVWSSGVTTVEVPYGGQQWPAWGQVDMSKWRKP